MRMKLLVKIVDRCVYVLAVIAALILLALLLGVCFATASRYLFNKPFAELIDLAGYSLVFIVFLGAPWLMSKRGHVRIDMFVEMVSPKAQKYWNAATNFAVVIIALVIAYIGFRLTGNYLINDRVMQDVMDTPQWILLLPIPLGSFFLALQALLNGIEDLKCAKSACPAEPEQPLEKAGL